MQHESVSLSPILRASETRMAQQPRCVGQPPLPHERHVVTVTRNAEGVEIIHVVCPCGRQVDLKLIAGEVA